MADRKITDLSAQTSLTGTDLMMLVRSGANYKITVANIITSILADHLADTADAHDASAISVLDTGNNFTGTNVETVLAELFGSIGVPNLDSDKATRTAGDVTTTSTTFVDLTGMSVTLTTGARRCLVVCNLNCKHPTGGNGIYYDLDIDGSRQGGTTGLVDINIPANNFEEPANFSFVTDVLSAASHTFKIQWRTSGGTATTFASTTSPAMLSVVEMYAA